jgi:crotonobetainyl-CoA:carnitine CoA-transferase CaiB-like acyl-CoA transferase
MEMTTQPGPLTGIRIIDLTTVVLGPYATQMLGDLGADVIKVESPEGDNCRWIGPSRNKGMGSYFAMLNRNKRSVVLDLKRPIARDALLRMVDSADVFVHNMRLGAAERLGLGYAALSARNPRLVYACASGFRKGSSKQEHPAFDDLIQGMSGLAALNAATDGAPRYVPSVIVDKLTGQMLASMVGMALLHRERTGQGQEVHVPMLETTLAFLLVEHMWGMVLNQPELGMGYPRMLTPHRRPYATQDGYISVIAVSDAHWRRLFEAMGRAALIDDPRFATIAARSDNVDALYGVLTEGMRERTTAEWLEILAALDIPSGPANTLPDLLDDAYLKETAFFQPMRHPLDGDVTITAFPARFSASPPSVRRLWPALGEHTEEVLREIGCSDEDIREIVRR